MGGGRLEELRGVTAIPPCPELVYMGRPEKPGPDATASEIAEGDTVSSVALHHRIKRGRIEVTELVSDDDGCLVRVEPSNGERFELVTREADE